MSIGRNIRILAFEKDITQKELAAAAGISEGIMSKIIHGEHVPSLRVIMALAKKMECSIDDLVKE